MTLDELKREMKECVKIQMEGGDSHGFVCFNGIRMDCRPEDVRRLHDGVVMAAMIGQTTMDIRDFDNVVHYGIPVAEVRQMVKELGNRLAARLKHKWALQKRIDAATTIAEVESIVWDEANAPYPSV